MNRKRDFMTSLKLMDFKNKLLINLSEIGVNGKMKYQENGT